MASDDQRRIIGRRVYAKELHVTALSECARRYGSWSKSKEVAGTVIECMENNTNNNWLITHVKSVYILGGGNLKTVELNIISVLKALNNPQYLVPEITQEPGEPLVHPVPPITPPKDTDNADDNIVVDLHQKSSIPDTIDVINVPEVATVSVPEAGPDAATE